jgi:Gram-negative porin
MWQAVRAGGAVAIAGLALVASSAPVRAASDVGIGGYHDQALQAAQRSLLAPSPEAMDARFQISIGSGPSSALTAFTPRFGGLGLGVGALGDRADRAPVSAGGTVDSSTEVHQLEIGLTGAEVAGWNVDLAATAGVTSPAASAAAGDAGLVVGGELAVSGLRFDAAYGEDADFMGFDGTRMTAGVAYGFGPVDTRMSYSLVERETAVDTSLFTVGSRLALQPGLVVQGDVAYADDENGEVSTAGRVSLRFNF